MKWLKMSVVMAVVALAGLLFQTQAATKSISVRISQESDDLEEWLAPKAGQTQAKTVGDRKSVV